MSTQGYVEGPEIRRATSAKPQAVPPGETGGDRPVDAGLEDIVARERDRERRVREAFLDWQERVATGQAPAEIGRIRGDSVIEEDLRFEVFLHALAAFSARHRRQVPFEVFMARNAPGRQALRRAGMRVPPPTERRAWEAWVRRRGPRPEALQRSESPEGKR